MKIQFEQDITLDNRYDIIITGGGPSGCAAAISAAREGASVLLIEASGALGGMGTIGMIPAWCPFSDKEKVIYQGIGYEIFQRVKEGMKHVSSEDVDWTPIDAEALKRVYDEMVREAGVTVLFNTQLVSAISNHHKVDYIIVSNKGGLTAYQGKMYVDCTGDADLVAMAGLPYEIGDEETHELQPNTHCFVLANVDEYQFRHSPIVHMNNPQSAVYKIAKSDKYPLVVDAHCCISQVGPRTFGFNAGHLFQVDPLDPFSVSEALMNGRQLAHQFHEGLKEFLPETYASSFLVSTAAALGIRESRRIIGEYTITIEDYIERKSFSDEIGRNCYFLDVHNSKKDVEKILSGKSNGEEEWRPYAPGESHGIPYRSLIPKNIENLLVAGRSISCDHRVQGSVRVMPVCFVTGQAAGMATWLALNLGDVRQVNVSLLRSKLRENGAYFE
ncbi:MAG: dependent oxidoreductase [Herbinix sp.]|jgi:hypothetical protein|nr:dependent oxidoreductase [Herbinix sp.]